MLTTNQTTHHIDLSSNCITNKEIQCLLELFDMNNTNGTLNVLDLHDNKLSVECEQRLKQIEESNKWIKIIL
ncbi:unnamed protein product [Didymodactylos carnosus]|nr:unnamed protein product [Didymodactylos carnosus]CAF3919910.1 unnamed protein product [Didymodactylos carnosus]